MPLVDVTVLLNDPMVDKRYYIVEPYKANNLLFVSKISFYKFVYIHKILYLSSKRFYEYN